MYCIHKKDTITIKCLSVKASAKYCQNDCVFYSSILGLREATEVKQTTNAIPLTPENRVQSDLNSFMPPMLYTKLCWRR